jgi:hypothetical protein
MRQPHHVDWRTRSTETRRMTDELTRLTATEAVARR